MGTVTDIFTISSFYMCPFLVSMFFVGLNILSPFFFYYWEIFPCFFGICFMIFHILLSVRIDTMSCFYVFVICAEWEIIMCVFKRVLLRVVWEIRLCMHVCSPCSVRNYFMYVSCMHVYVFLCSVISVCMYLAWNSITICVCVILSICRFYCVYLIVLCNERAKKKKKNITPYNIGYVFLRVVWAIRLCVHEKLLSVYVLYVYVFLCNMWLLYVCLAWNSVSIFVVWEIGVYVYFCAVWLLCVCLAWNSVSIFVVWEIGVYVYFV